MSITYTDQLGCPVQKGNIVAYPVKYGSSSAQLVWAQVDEIVPLIEKSGTWLGRGRVPFIREDQQTKAYPTEFYVPHDRNDRPRLDKAYIVKCCPLKQNGYDSPEFYRATGYGARTKTLHNVDRIVVMDTLAKVVECPEQ